MSGRVGDLSPFQERTLTEFKELLADAHQPGFDDYFYLRWLRARNFDKGKSEAMLRKSLAWRKRMGVDTLVTDYTPPQLLDECYPRSLLGHDKTGCPVRYMPFKNLDLRGMAMSLPKMEIVKFLTYLYEQERVYMQDQEKKFGKVIENSTYILDIDSYTFKQATNRQSVDTLNCLLRSFEANYPERLKAAIFINVPVFFSMALALSKPFLSEATINKFRIFGKDGYQEFLPTIIDADILPASLGGNRKDPDGDPYCKTVINYGKFVPKSNYFNQTNRKFPDEEGVKELQLERGSYQCIEVEIAEEGSRLQWEVETDNYDIGIGLSYWVPASDTCDPVLEEILPVDRVNCHLVPESCAYMCDRSGIYALKFDNSYSWFFQKKVHYRITVYTPKDLQKENGN